MEDEGQYTLSGAAAHQMTAWNGRNALTAVIHFFVNIDGMLSSIRPESRVQGVIVEGGAAPNVVPDRTVADFYLRYPDAVDLEQLTAMVDDAERAAALEGIHALFGEYQTALRKAYPVPKVPDPQ